MGETRRELMVAELKRLDEEVEALDREWRRVSLLFAFVVLAAPAYFIWGPLAAFYTVLFTPCLVVTAAYLVGVRKREAKDLREELQQQLTTL